MNALLSIRARLTLAFTLGIALLLLVTGVALTWNAYYQAERSADTVLKAVARKVEREWREDASRTAAHGNHGHGHRRGRQEWEEASPPSLTEIMADERDLSSENVALLWVDARNRVVQQSQSRAPTWPQYNTRDWRTILVREDGNTVVIALDWRKTRQTLRSQTLALFALSASVLLFVSGGAWLLVGQALSPIARLSQQAQEATGGLGQVRLRAPSRDAEIVNLVATLNGLLQRLHESAAMKGRFYAAASHELRTPLQALSGHLELALTRPRDTEAYHIVVQEAYAQTRRLTTLVRDLLLLTQLETAPLPPAEPVDVAALCAAMFCAQDATIVRRQLHIVNRLPDMLEVTAPPTHLEMLTRNLIENAVKYATEGSEVVMAGWERGFTLENACAPLTETDLHRLFEPFYRPDASRQAETGGNGLGLAICKAIADANGWTVALAPTPQGLRVTVAFRL